MTTRDQLRRVPLFASLPPVEIDVLAVSLESSSFPANTVVFQEGDPGDRLYIVLSGEVEIIKALDTPQERRLGTYGPGAFSERWACLAPTMSDRPASESAKTPSYSS